MRLGGRSLGVGGFIADFGVQEHVMPSMEAVRGVPEGPQEGPAVKTGAVRTWKGSQEAGKRARDWSSP